MEKKGVEKILRKALEDMGWFSWSKKSSTLFSIKSRFGSLISAKDLDKIYDEIKFEEELRIEKEKNGN